MGFCLVNIHLSHGKPYNKLSFRLSQLEATKNCPSPSAFEDGDQEKIKGADPLASNPQLFVPGLKQAKFAQAPLEGQGLKVAFAVDLVR
jgi:hypothetical protein